MKAIIICIGDELLLGQTVDTNSVFIAQELGKIGVQVCRKLVLADDRNEILQALQSVEHDAEIVIITGGLGPTKDDITKHVLCEFFNCETYFDDNVWQNVLHLFAKMNKIPNELNRSQATLPKACTVLNNEVGTAPGMWFEKENKKYISMPGVPFEMKYIMENSVLPMLSQSRQGSIFHKYIMTIGIGESDLAKLVALSEENLPKEIKLAYLPEIGKVKLRLSAYHVDEKLFHPLMDKHFKEILDCIPPQQIYALDNKNMGDVVHELLIEHNKTLSTAESFSSGIIANEMLSRSGSSQFFKGSLIAYQNEVKQKYLNVKIDTIQQFEVESEEVAREMLEGCLQMFNSDFAIATTGIAGPTGEKPEKPVGTVFIAVGNKEQKIVEKHFLRGNRNDIIQRSKDIALNILRKLMLNDVDNLK